jgi:hypothetical protein
VKSRSGPVGKLPKANVSHSIAAEPECDKGQVKDGDKPAQPPAPPELADDQPPPAPDPSVWQYESRKSQGCPHMPRHRMLQM